MEGFKTSTDYEALFYLIHKGYRIPAWILYTDKFGADKKIYDLVEVKKSYMSASYSIGTRGRGYESGSSVVSDFIKDCMSIELKYVVPNFTFDYSKSCDCKERIGETWCCNQCGLPTNQTSTNQ